ncbi:MAG: hypothetical protein Ct9H300mP28_14970 [Pseudomonadota bacterium]|nr:MAG: hypothetical protein Ct9H300mP28_14970 [Pseudomonadota bacterium]
MWRGSEIPQLSHFKCPVTSKYEKSLSGKRWSARFFPLSRISIFSIKKKDFSKKGFQFLKLRKAAKDMTHFVQEKTGHSFFETAFPGDILSMNFSFYQKPFPGSGSRYQFELQGASAGADSSYALTSLMWEIFQVWVRFFSVPD